MTERKRLFPIAVALLLIAAAVAVGLGVRQFLAERSGTVTTSGIALIGGPFALVDGDGKPRTDADFRGKLMLVYFGYTFCPDLCPTELQAISDALDSLGAKAAQIQPLFISIDPARDTPPVMKDYVGHFNPQIIGLTGTAAQVAAAARAYRVYYAKVPAKDGGADYLMDHSGFVYLMSRDGKYLTHFTPDIGAAQMAQTIAKYL